jgi:hypothetical protein
MVAAQFNYMVLARYCLYTNNPSPNAPGSCFEFVNIRNTATGQSVRAVTVDFCQPNTPNNLGDISQAVIDSLWPNYTIGMRMDATVEYTGEFVPVMDFESGSVIGGSFSRTQSQDSANVVVDEPYIEETATWDAESHAAESSFVSPYDSEPEKASATVVAASASKAEHIDVSKNSGDIEPTPEASAAIIADARSSGSSRVCVVSALAAIALFLLC